MPLPRLPTGEASIHQNILYGIEGNEWETTPHANWTYIALPREEFEGLRRGFECLKEAVSVYSQACSSEDKQDFAALLDTNRRITAEIARLRGVVDNARKMLELPPILGPKVRSDSE